MIPAGQMLGKYRIVRQLGAGGMSDVYEAVDTTLERHVALKVLPTEFGGDSEAVQRFRKEVLAVAALDHPGIVTIFEVDATEDHQYYAMRLLDGGNLKSRLLDSPLQPAEALGVLRALAEALGHAHEAGIVHRDIKPENILFTAKGQPVIVDFGIAKKLSGNTRITAIGTSVGTPFYMSPEQAQASKELDARSDIYSLGVLLYEMLNGTVPYDATTAVGVALQHVNDPVPTLPDRFAALQPLLARMMAKQPAARPQDAAELVREIDRALESVKSMPAAPTSAAAEGDDPRPADDADAGPLPAEPQVDPSETDTQPPEPRRPAPQVVDKSAAAPAGGFDPQTEFELMAVTPTANPAVSGQTVVAKEPPDITPPGETPEASPTEPADPEPAEPEPPDSEPAAEPGAAAEAPDPVLEAGARAAAGGGQDPAIETGSGDAEPAAPEAEPPPPPPDRFTAPTTAMPIYQPDPEPAEPPELPEPPDLPAAPSPAAAPPEAERWRSGDLYQKPPPPPLLKRPVFWIAAAAVALAGAALFWFGGSDDGEPTPLELVTGDSPDGPQGIGLRTPVRRDTESPAGSEDPVEEARDAPPPDPEPAAEDDLDALLLEALDAETGGDAAPESQPDPEPPPTTTDADAEPSRPRDSGSAGQASEPAPQRAAQPAASRQPSAAVTQLLLDAQLFEAADQLTLPPGENAWEAWQQVLDLDPSNREALRGLARLQATYVSRCEAALAAGDRDAAQAAIERLAFIDPDHPDLERLRAALPAAAAAADPPAATFSDTLRSGGNGPLMRRVPAGRLDPLAGPDPQATIAAFALGEREISVDEFSRFVNATGYVTPPEGSGGCNYWLFNWRQRPDKGWQSPGFNQSGDHPVVCVSYGDARAYAAWLSEATGQRYRLPTRLEWEYAARLGGAGSVLWASERDACDHANVSDVDRAERHNLEVSAGNIFGCRDGRVTTAPGASYQPSAGGFYDLLGNAAEWTADCATPDGDCGRGVTRGGSWFERPAEVSTGSGLPVESEARFSHIGFRVARELSGGR